ncbi:hypothetical protein FOBRF1_008492 [Fusarium oxysporum]
MELPLDIAATVTIQFWSIGHKASDLYDRETGSISSKQCRNWLRSVLVLQAMRNGRNARFKATNFVNA